MKLPCGIAVLFDCVCMCATIYAYTAVLVFMSRQGSANVMGFYTAVGGGVESICACLSGAE